VHPRRCQPCAAIPATAAPRQALWRHPGAVGTYGDKTPPQRPLCHVRAPRQQHPRIGPPRQPVYQLLCRSPRNRSCASTGRTTTPQPERDSPGRSSAPQHCSPYRYTCRNSAARMLTTPSLAYKRGVDPQPQGRDTGRRTAVTHTLSASPTILALASIKPLGLGGHASSPASLVATPLRAPRCKQYSAPSTPLLDVRPRPEPG
jgi:hypothetical protein